MTKQYYEGAQMTKQYYEQFNLIDKSRFSDGPWIKEPDAVSWTNYGLPCLIKRIEHSGHLCGYVGVFKQHPLYKKEQNELENFEQISVHGGVSLCGFNEKNDALHFRVDGVYEEFDKFLKVWWIGFDCFHWYDYAPMYSLKSIKIEEISEYRDIEYVKTQVNNLAKQLYDLSDYTKDESNMNL